MSKHPVQLFREIHTLEGLQIGPEEKDWLEGPPARPQPRETVLYLGCNVLRTPHLAQTVTAIFRRLGEDFVALAGPAFCCGVPYQNQGGMEEASRQGERLASRFRQFHPQRVVMWCPGCYHFYKHVLSQGGPFELLHVTEFLAQSKDRFSFAPQQPTRVALHYHCGSPDADRQADAARTLLRAVPGVELIGLDSSEAWGRNCFGNLRDRMGREAWEALIIPSFQVAVAAGAAVFATLHHGCYRMYAGHEKDFPLAVEHYLTVVARAMGITYPEKYKQYLLRADAIPILEDAWPCLRASSIPEERALPVVEHVFVKDRGF